MLRGDNTYTQNDVKEIKSVLSPSSLAVKKAQVFLAAEFCDDSYTFAVQDDKASRICTISGPRETPDAGNDENG